MAFIWYAFNEEKRRFRNFMDFQRRWLEEQGSDDSHARALWSLGVVLGRSTVPSLQNMASRLFEQALPPIIDVDKPRSWAFALFGISEYLRRFAGDRKVSQIGKELAERLLALYQNHRVDDWHWYEDQLTYSNAILPHAMLLSGQWIPDLRMTEAGLESLSWLANLQRAEGDGEHFVPIGSDGFYPRGGVRARFDQQPLEAQAMISACLEARRITGDSHWHEEAGRAFEWFLGRNDLNIPLYDPISGGCRDGLHPDRANENQGAESTLAFLQALLELRLAENATTFQPLELQHI
jgi:hypothetical protein